MFSLGFESSKFEPCNKNEKWWVDAPQEFYKDYMSITDSRYKYIPIYIEVTGDVSVLGTYGHLGAYDREFTIIRVVTMRKATKHDCTELN